MAIVLTAAAVLFPLSACGAPVAAPPSPVGTWRVTYGAPALVRIEATGSDQYVITAATPVTVTGATCQLPIGTAIATMTGSGTAYTGQHGLWNIANCAFAQYTTMSLTVNGDNAVEQLGNGESRALGQGVECRHRQRSLVVAVAAPPRTDPRDGVVVPVVAAPPPAHLAVCLMGLC